MFSVWCIDPSESYAQLDSSNLPILVINTDDVILDDPKVTGSLRIYSNAPSGYNKTSDEPEFRHDIAIEYRGNTSQKKYPKKGLGFELRSQENKPTTARILELPAHSDWVIHSPYGDKTLMRNVLTYHLADQIMDYAPKTRLCELILNKEYYGVVVLTERINIGEGRVKITPPKDGKDLDGEFIFKFDKGDDEEVAFISSHFPNPKSKTPAKILFHDPEAGAVSKEQKKDLRRFFAHFEHEINEDDFDEETEYEDYIEVTSFIDYILISELTKNIDAYRISTYFTLQNINNRKKLKAGPVWDYNLAYGNANYCEAYLTSGWSLDFNAICPDHDNLVHFWWIRLLQHPKFSALISQRYNELRATYWQEERIWNFIDHTAQTLSGPQARNHAKWRTLGAQVWPNKFVGQTYSEEVEYLKTWVGERLQWMDENIEKINHDSTAFGFLSYRVFPNPAQDQLQVELRSLHETQVKISLIDMYGRRIWSSENNYPKNTHHILDMNVSEFVGPHTLQFVIDDKSVVNRKVIFTGQ